MSDKDDKNKYNDEDDENIVVMFDDEGNEQELYIFGNVEYNGDNYLIVSENLDNEIIEKDEEQEVIVLKEIKVNSDYDDSDKIDYQVVEDDDLLEIIISLFEEQGEEE